MELCFWTLRSMIPVVFAYWTHWWMSFNACNYHKWFLGVFLKAEVSAVSGSVELEANVRQVKG